MHAKRAEPKEPPWIHRCSRSHYGILSPNRCFIVLVVHSVTIQMVDRGKEGGREAREWERKENGTEKGVEEGDCGSNLVRVD